MLDAYDLLHTRKPKHGKSSPTVFPPRPLAAEETSTDDSALLDRSAGRFSLRKRAPVRYKETASNKVNAIYHPVRTYKTDTHTVEYEPLSATFKLGEWYYYTITKPSAALGGLPKRFHHMSSLLPPFQKLGAML